MTKALFFDIDGTLVSFETHRIPDSTVEALSRIHQQGIQIFISTGRPKILINNLKPLQDLQLIDGYITMNGGYCFVGDEVIYKSAIPHHEAEAVLQYCTDRHIPCVIVGEHDICVCHPNEQTKAIFHDFLKVDFIPEVQPEEALLHKEVYQMTPFVTEEQECEMMAHLSHCEVGRWHPAFADITALGNTKQKGIDQIIGHFQIPLEQTMAFGDGGNDISMLRHAGIGVAMGNSTPQVQAHADYVTEPIDNDGVMKALQHFGII